MTCHRVLIEVKRIQTYLFAVPKLRTMLGANALIGETLRIKLAELAHSKGAGLPIGVDVPHFLSIEGEPLANATASSAGPGSTWVADNPEAAYSCGVLTRDGGHLQALFDNLNAAGQFADEAAGLIESELPALMFEVRVERWNPDAKDKGLATGWKRVFLGNREALQPLYEPPNEKICEWSGQGAGKQRNLAPEKPEKPYLSDTVFQQWNKGTEFRKGKTDDLVGLLQRATRSDGSSLLPCYGNGWKDPEELKEVAGGEGRYLALIHADGNSVGERKPEADDKAPLNGEDATGAFKRWFDAEGRVEAFFHSMRRHVRAALVEALRRTFQAGGEGGFRPYQLLMVGGDDLLLLMRAEYALPFIVHYARALREEFHYLSDGKALDVGVGVAIGKPAFPFHALHALAEELAASAKRLARGQPGRSVVDWAVITQSAAVHPEGRRRAHDIVRYKVDGASETLLLSGKPYFVLDESSAGVPSLESLLRLADTFRAAEAARSQRKALGELLRRGRRAGQQSFEDWYHDLPESLRDDLKKCGFDKAWQRLDEGPYLTRVLDLVEVAEIPSLGRRRSRSDLEEPEVARR